MHSIRSSRRREVAGPCGGRGRTNCIASALASTAHRRQARMWRYGCSSRRYQTDQVNGKQTPATAEIAIPAPRRRAPIAVSPARAIGTTRTSSHMRANVTPASPAQPLTWTAQPMSATRRLCVDFLWGVGRALRWTWVGAAVHAEPSFIAPADLTRIDSRSPVSSIDVRPQEPSQGERQSGGECELHG